MNYWDDHLWQGYFGTMLVYERFTQVISDLRVHKSTFKYDNVRPMNI